MSKRRQHQKKISTIQRFKIAMEILNDCDVDAYAKRYGISVHQMGMIRYDAKRAIQAAFQISNQDFEADLLKDFELPVWEKFEPGLPRAKADKKAAKQWKQALTMKRVSLDPTMPNFADDWLLIGIEKNGLGIFEHLNFNIQLPPTRNECETLELPDVDPE